jgi:putative intracellular protease/amidase
MAAPLKDIPSPAAPDAAGFEDVEAVETVEELAAAVATVEVAAAD